MPPDQLRFQAMGTSCHLLGLGLERGVLARGAAWVADMNERLSRFLPDSELSRLNRAAGRWTAVSPELHALLEAALAAWRSSGGLVHVGVLPAMHAIGYTRPLAQGPTAALLEAAQPPPPLPEMLEMRAGQARVAAGTGIDLGGIAKGWMADRLIDRLGADSVANLGGDLRARGGGPGGDGWPVGMGGVTVMLSDQGAATSASRHRSWDGEGQRLHHLIDPRTGRPSSSDVSEVSVVAATAADAEVHAKTALLLGARAAVPYLAGHAAAWWMA